MNPRPVEPSWYAHLNCVILQPSYLPWRGYFHQIQKADVFVFYDDVQVDKHGWRNRNLVKGPNGLQWLSVPILSKGATHGLALNDVRIDPSDPRWARKHRQTLKQLYGKMPHFKRYADVLAPFYEDPPELLVELTINTTVALARAMGLAPRFVRSSELNIEGGKVERLVAITQHVEATHYITGPAATSYLDEDPFRRAGIDVEYMEYDYPEYEQRFPPFESQVSIVDLLFAVGPEAPRYIWDPPNEPRE